MLNRTKCPALVWLLWFTKELLKAMCWVDGGGGVCPDPQRQMKILKKDDVVLHWFLPCNLASLGFTSYKPFLKSAYSDI